MFRCSECTLLRNGIAVSVNGQKQVCEECWPYVQKAQSCSVTETLPSLLQRQLLAIRKILGLSGILEAAQDKWIAGQGGAERAIIHIVKNCGWSPSAYKEAFNEEWPT